MYVCMYVCMYVFMQAKITRKVGQGDGTSGQHLTNRSLIPSKESIAGTLRVFHTTTLTSNTCMGGSATSSGG